MMWRLNFFVIIVCVALNNEYMLYYINPMHTLFTLMVYGIVGIMHQLNSNNTFIWVKFAIAMVICFLLWDFNDGGLVMLMSRPFSFVLGFHDPGHPLFDELHEWQFRTGLDHYVWIFGMFCAFTHPRFSAYINSMDNGNGTTSRVVLGAVGVVPFVIWAATIFPQQKYDYNALHPYTSFIPLGSYIIVRNLTPTLRSYYMKFYATAGKITLETYILQFHVWMKTTGINGSPKHLLAILPADYYFLNFILTTAMFVGMSFRCFRLTMLLRDVFIPRKKFTFRKVGTTARTHLLPCL
jgi:hypothetical protein